MDDQLLEAANAAVENVPASMPTEAAVTSNVAVAAHSTHATTFNLGTAAQPVARADYPMSERMCDMVAEMPATEPVGFHIPS